MNRNWLAGPEEIVLGTAGLQKSYFRGTPVPVLRGVDLAVGRGEFVSIVGASGSGKSTLLHLLGLLDRADQGQIHWKGERIDDRPRAFRDWFRNQVVGFVFQFYHLLPELTTLENVMLPKLVGQSLVGYLARGRSLKRHTAELLDRVGLAHRLRHKPRELSGGEMQRAAIARALVTRPEILLADEPTGNLDDQTGWAILELLDDLRREIGLTVILVTHDPQVAARADRIVRLHQGRIESARPPHRAVGT